MWGIIMNSVDLVLILIVLLSFYIGWKTGMIRILAGIGSLILGYQAARIFSAVLAEKITSAIPALTPPTEQSGIMDYLFLIINTETVANRIVQVVAFIIIFIVVGLIVRWLASILDKLFHGTILGAANGLLGAVAGVIVIVLLFNFAYAILLPTFNDSERVVGVLSYFQRSELVLPMIIDSGNTVLNIPEIGNVV